MIAVAVALVAVSTAALAYASGPTQAGSPIHSDGPAAGGESVWAVQAEADGGVSFAVYRSAPGVSAEKLYSELLAQGVQGLRDPAKDPTVMDRFQCYHGTSFAWDGGFCPPARWHRSGFSDPQVYFRDFTPVEWPVRASVTKWHEAVGIDSYWTVGGCPGGGRHCVAVHAHDYGANGWSGSTYGRLDASRYFVDGSVYIKLNDRYAATGADRRNTACHETGHALGVGHSTTGASCMYPQNIPSNPQYPNASDYNLLRYVLYKD